MMPASDHALRSERGHTRTHARTCIIPPQDSSLVFLICSAAAVWLGTVLIHEYSDNMVTIVFNVNRRKTPESVAHSALRSRLRNVNLFPPCFPRQIDFRSLLGERPPACTRVSGVHVCR